MAVVIGVAREQAGCGTIAAAREKVECGTIAAALGVSVANRDLGVRLRFRLFVGVGEGGVVVVVVGGDGLVVVAVVEDWNSAEEFEPPVRGLEPAAGVPRLVGFVLLDGGTPEVSALILFCAVEKRTNGGGAGMIKKLTTGTANDHRTPSGGRTVSLSQRISTVRVASART